MSDSQGAIWLRLVDGNPPHRDVARLGFEHVPAVGDLMVIDGWVWDVVGRMWFPQTERPSVVLKVTSIGALP